MRRCFRGRWTYAQVSEIYHLVWRFCLFDYSIWTLLPWSPMPPAAFSTSSDSVLVGLFARSAMSSASSVYVMSRDGSRRRRGGNDTPPPVELTLSSSQKVTVMRECGSHRCSHLSDLGSPDIGRGRRKWSQMIGGGTPNGSGVPFPSTEVNTKKGSFWASLVADGR